MANDYRSMSTGQETPEALRGAKQALLYRFPDHQALRNARAQLVEAVTTRCNKPPGSSSTIKTENEARGFSVTRGFKGGKFFQSGGTSLTVHASNPADVDFAMNVLGAPASRKYSISSAPGGTT